MANLIMIAECVNGDETTWKFNRNYSPELLLGDPTRWEKVLLEDFEDVTVYVGRENECLTDDDEVVANIDGDVEIEDWEDDDRGSGCFPRIVSAYDFAKAYNQ